MNKNGFKSKCKVKKIGATDDTLTGRGGTVLFVKYLSSVEIYPLLQIFKPVKQLQITFTTF